MRIDIATLFPEMCETVLSESIIGRARRNGKIEMHCHNIRDYTINRQKSVDDYPYGGGHGMVLQAQPLYLCCKAIEAQQQVEKPHVIFMTAGGKRFTQQRAKELAQLPAITLVCGHYEGIDERAYALADRVISLGDYVLTSGELASMVVIDAAVRKLPGVLGAETGALGESFADGLLEYPQYTRPATFRGMGVPPVLLSGNHAAVADWRRKQSLERTARLRPDLLEDVDLSAADRAYLKDLGL